MQLHADDLGRFEGKRPDVGILAVLVAAQQVHREGDELLDAPGNGHLEGARVLVHALEVLLEAQRVQLLAFRVPVGANAFENAGSIVEAVSEQADLGVRVVNDLTVEEHPGLLAERRCLSNGNRGGLSHQPQPTTVGGGSRYFGPPLRTLCYAREVRKACLE